MKWDMEVEEIEAVLEKIWDLHDKLSDAIHSITRAHFLNSVKSHRKSGRKQQLYGDETPAGFVFVKDFRVDESDSAIEEAKSLNAIRTALENLEDQLEFFHTVQLQQRTERDSAIARLEQSRIVLAMRLAEHHGNKYKVIEEALAFVGDVRDAVHFVSPENLYGSQGNLSGENVLSREGKGSNVLFKVVVSSIHFAKKSLKLDHMGGILGNAALFSVSMIAMLHLHQVTNKNHSQKQEGYINDKSGRYSRMAGPSSQSKLSNLDVLLARG